MGTSRRRLILGSLAPLAAAAAAVPAARPRPAGAQDAFPSRPVRLIVPYAGSGTSADLFARIFAEAIGPRLGQRVVVDNRPGAGGTIGAAQAARAPADGYTVLWAASSLFQCNPYLYRSIQYRLEDFTAIGCFSDAAFVLFARKGLGVRDLPELLARMRAAPGAVRFANGGIGSQLHLTWERLMRVAGVESMVVPFAPGQTLAALLAGDMDIGFSVLDPQQLQYYASGDFVPLAMTGAVRHPKLPEVATFIESGFPGFTATGGYAAWAPRGVPEPALARLRREFDAVTEDPALVARLDALAAEIPPWRKAADLESWIVEDRELWRRIIVETGVTLG